MADSQKDKQQQDKQQQDKQQKDKQQQDKQQQDKQQKDKQQKDKQQQDKQQKDKQQQDKQQKDNQQKDKQQQDKQQKDKQQEDKQQQDEQQQDKQQQDQKKESARSPRRQANNGGGVENPKPPRQNKLYRTPPSPYFSDLIVRESSFVLDSVAVASISEDYSRANPKLGSALPTYNSQKDKHVKNYFQFFGVDKTLGKNQQAAPGTSIEGKIYDKFYTTGHGFRYLTVRNEKQPYAYSNEERMGHGQLWKHPNPKLAKYDRMKRDFRGYNGEYGFRRTTPRLRPSSSNPRAGDSFMTDLY